MIPDPGIIHDVKVNATVVFSYYCSINACIREKVMSQAAVVSSILVLPQFVLSLMLRLSVNCLQLSKVLNRSG